MKSYENIIVTDISGALVVHFKKCDYSTMTDRESYGLAFSNSGQITYSMNGKNYVSGLNKAILIPKNATYSIHCEKEGYFPVINFDCKNLGLTEFTEIPLNNVNSCIKDFEKIQKLFLFKENRLLIYSTFYELLNKVLNEQLLQNHILYPVFQYIEENFSDCSLSNNALAEHIGISEVYLRKLFLSQYNTTPKQYILNIRIQKAKQLLTETALSVSNISEECGFSSLYHFCRCFKEKTGSTPTQFAKQNKIYEI